MKNANAVILEGTPARLYLQVTPAYLRKDRPRQAACGVASKSRAGDYDTAAKVPEAVI